MLTITLKKILLRFLVFSFLLIDSTEILENVKESVKIAKEAVSLDVTDGRSWCMSPPFFMIYSEHVFVALIIRSQFCFH